MIKLKTNKTLIQRSKTIRNQNNKDQIRKNNR
jgi:hypothetical protein